MLVRLESGEVVNSEVVQIHLSANVGGPSWIMHRLPDGRSFQGDMGAIVDLCEPFEDGGAFPISHAKTSIGGTWSPPGGIVEVKP